MLELPGPRQKRTVEHSAVIGWRRCLLSTHYQEMPGGRLSSELQVRQRRKLSFDSWIMALGDCWKQLSWFYYQYLLVTALYMLEPWERTVFSILFRGKQPKKRANMLAS